ncbi:DotU family type IV/VI secretion system protein [Citrobacter freundii]|nr:DotU family type IV/VI secretion system protein [Citrobacter freundii]
MEIDLSQATESPGAILNAKPSPAEQRAKENAPGSEVTASAPKDKYDGFFSVSSPPDDNDPDYRFALRGNSLNPIIDATTPLFGMVIRIRTLSVYEDVASLWRQVSNEIEAIEQELKQQGYGHEVLLPFRYMLCTYIDEAVMAHEWGSQSEWAKNSLLSQFHGETWGGEKVFAVLDKLQTEPRRYRDILEFMLQCLMLGFKGRYAVSPQGDSELHAITQRLHHLLYPKPASRHPVRFVDAGKSPPGAWPLARQTSLWVIPGAGLSLVAVVFSIFHHLLHQQTLDVLHQLGELLK